MSWPTISTTRSPAARRPKRPGARCPSALVGNCAAVLPELLRRGVAVDIVTDQTSAHDPLSYLPEGVDLADWHDYAEAKPEEFTDRARVSMAKHVEAMVGFLDPGAEVFDYGNSIRDEARQGGFGRAFEFPGFVPAYIRPLFCEGKGPFRWAALSGDPDDIRRHRRGDPRPVPGQRPPAPLDPRRAGPGGLPGPARPDLLARLRRARQGRCPLQRHGRRRRDQRPDRHRSRPSRLRLGRLALPGDRIDGRRFGRDRRLAAAQRHGQHRVRRDLGLDPPRRRRRHRPVPARRSGHRGRRHRAGRRRRSSGC